MLLSILAVALFAGIDVTSCATRRLGPVGNADDQFRYIWGFKDECIGRLFAEVGEPLGPLFRTPERSASHARPAPCTIS